MIEFKHGAGRRLQERHLKDALSEVKMLRARIAKLEAALRFYADAENWRRNGQLDPDSGNFTGGPARAALAGGKDE